MTDREMLALAAKAAGYEVELDHQGVFHIHEGTGPQSWRPWNPRDDDGDAFRLAVKLGDTFLVKVGICRQLDKAFCHVDDVATRENLTLTDPLAATRRAITRAAAETGRNME